MEVYTIYTKRTKQGNARIRIVTSNATGRSCYSYYSEHNIDEPNKSTFNKYAFIEYLKGIRIPKKYINEVEKLATV